MVYILDKILNRDSADDQLDILNKQLTIFKSELSSPYSCLSEE